ncbi:hypothetical protein JX266_005462 [Neoarthrinium moseri]|nr:hypothetical protein JX266_005462 [Neoarthrinium moseri]
MGDFAAADLSDAALGGSISIEDGRFVDGYGRALMLRGFNVSGGSKLPTKPNGLSHLTDGFYEHRTVTFTGRPFPLGDAHLHFRRLQAWGLPFIRLLVTWESIGHAGPNPTTDLDLEYIAYLRQLIQMMPQYGIKCFICAHQDVWSRFSGGSGAPGWTFEAAGLNIEAFTDTGAAYVHGQDELRRAQAPVNEKEPSGPFVWPSGYQKLAASTMATLFWAGDALAPDLRCRRSPLSGSGEPEEVSVQEFLQGALVEAFGRLADEVAGLEACVGFEPMNEPHRGLVNLHGFHNWNYDTDLHIGYYPSLAQALALGSGYAQTVPYYVKSWPWPTRQSHQSLVDPLGRSAWIDDVSGAGTDRPRGLGKCVWRAHGAWDWDEKSQKPVVLKPDYFEYDHRPGSEGTRIEWYRDCYSPFLRRFSERVSRKSPKYFSLVEPIPNEFMPPWAGESAGNRVDQGPRQEYAVQTALPVNDRPRNLVYAPHFYDLNVLFSKSHAWMSVNVQGLARGMFVLNGLYFGSSGLRRNYRKQIGNIVAYGRASLGKLPVVIGEIGIPYDINNGHAFLTGDYDKQRDLMGALISSMEDNLIDGFSLWNYNPDNRVEYGDGWNREDFSVINGDDVITGDQSDRQTKVRPDYRNAIHESDELYRGCRVLDTVIRPYAVKVAGVPRRSDWNPRTLRYEFEWASRELTERMPNGKCSTTEIYIPSYHYSKHKLHIKASHGLAWSFDESKQTLFISQKDISASLGQKVSIEIDAVQTHLMQRVRQQREALSSHGLGTLVPPLLIAMWETVTFTYLALLGISIPGVLGAVLFYELLK